MNDSLRFPDGFVWGTATAAHQVEGGNFRNDWWLWEQMPGHIRNNDSAAVACDWWHRAEDDIALAARLNMGAQRVSLEWSRIEPRPGEWDEEALARYRRMLESICAQGMQPLVCLFHFTLPQWVAGRGGWENTWTLDRFARFVDKVAGEYGDLVRWWLTINEPMVYTALGWVMGVWPPGKHRVFDAARVARNLVLAHAQAYHIVHRHRPDAMVSAAMHMASYVPHTPGARGDRIVAAARHWATNHLWLQATLDGVLRPPLGRFQRIGEAVDSHDYLGFQYYFTYPLAFAWRRPTNFFIQEMVDLVPGAAAMMGENRPEGLYTWARWFSRYGKPMVVTENGLLETVERQRPAYLLRALAALHRAIQEGADVRAYYHWSLVDNFEWAEGYAARFGLVHVDFATQQRTVKRSGWLYAEIARANAITPEMAADIDPALVGELFGSQGALSSSAGGDS